MLPGGNPGLWLAFLPNPFYNPGMTLAHTLLQLQQTDTRLGAHRQRLAELARWFAQAPEVERAQAARDRAWKASQEAQRAFREAEARLQEVQDKLRRTEARLYDGSVRNPKELQDLQREAEALQRRLGELETVAVEALMAAEEAEAALQQAEAALKQAREQRAAAEAQRRAEQQRLEGEVPQLEARREALLAQLPPEVAATYERLRQRKHGLAVAEVQEQACSACGATLTSALLQEARDGNTLTFCQECGRILVAR